jgi:TolA-binding protein
MISPSCLRAGSLIAARAAGLSRADGLWLEEHIHACMPCTREAELLSGVRAILLDAEPELSSEARNRAIRRSLHAHRRGTASPTSRAPVRPFMMGLGFATALALLAIAGMLRRDDASGVATPPAVAAAAIPRVEQPVVVMSDADRLQAGARVHTKERVHVIFAHASVELAPGSDAQWNGASRELSLRSGAVIVEVDPEPHRSFSVATNDFRAEVLGTRFEVTPSSVSVSRGRVRVAALDGRERAVLNAGERYDLEAEAAVLAPKRAKRSEARKPVSNAAPTPVLPPDVAALLTEARDALATDRFEQARRAIDRALSAQPAGATRAEALTLRAELLSAQGNRAGAVAAYLEVATRFQSMPAGENALFAAARMHDDAAAAKKLLAQYLERYPRGRFVVEAKYRLKR